MSRIIYLDYASTTPVDPAVARVMRESLEGEDAFGNAASVTHVLGRRAEMRIEAARAQIASFINARPEEIIFTSGATESNNLAILGVARANAHRGRHIVASRIEHKSVLDPCKRLEKEGFAVTYVDPDRTGRVRPEDVAEALRPDTVLVSIMYVSNEIGVIQEVSAIAALCRKRGVLFHTDAAQAAGKLPLDVRASAVDFLSFTAHKLSGPKGIGALFVARECRPCVQPILFGGGQEYGLRSGTLATHQILGFAAACEIAHERMPAERARLAAMADELWRGVQELGGVHLNGEGAPRVPDIVNISFEGVDGESLVTGLPSLAVTTGSACSSASGEPSYVLRALGRSTELAQSSLRFSMGKGTTSADIAEAAAHVRAEVRRLRVLSPANKDGKVPEPQCETVEVHEPDTLASLTRRYFTRLPRAGSLPEAATTVRGEAGNVAREAWVRFHLAFDDKGTVKDARFQAYGCPHTLAAAAWLAEQLPGRSRADLVPGSPADWAAALSVPTEKLGRLLVVEDALRACLSP